MNGTYMAGVGHFSCLETRSCCNWMAPMSTLRWSLLSNGGDHGEKMAGASQLIIQSHASSCVRTSSKVAPSRSFRSCALTFVTYGYVSENRNAVRIIEKRTTNTEYESRSLRSERTVFASSRSLIFSTRLSTRALSSSTLNASPSPAFRSHADCCSRTHRSRRASSVKACFSPGMALKYARSSSVRSAGFSIREAWERSWPPNLGGCVSMPPLAMLDGIEH
mmetsp:Transcript_36309/g.90374  ORF Transcript_36309/g.90374 Transcript_36309/m.90374 type:complete len:221 (+) Transcript_36309:2130-2792(+)